MGAQTIINIGLLVVMLTCYTNPGQALQCHFCIKFGSFSNVTCTGTIKNCSSSDSFCNTYFIQSKDGSSSEFTRDCVTATVCEPGFCKKMEEQMDKTNCEVKCCNTDLCNRDAIKSSACIHGLASVVLIILASLLLLLNDLY